MVEQLYGDILGPGAVLGGYVVDELASQGGFAAVYRARHAASGEPAAVKVLHRGHSASTRMLERFRRESEVIQRLRHPHIVVLHEVGELTDGRPFIAMEWLPGGDLQGELERRGPFTLRETVAVLEEIGAALSEAHAAGIVHRDVKTQNVMTIPRDGWFTTKLVDFGIAKVRFPGETKSFTSGTVMGTPRTAAPEQILGDQVDERTDVYALGQLLFQLLTGALPFEAATAAELEEMHLFQAPPAVSTRAAVPPAMDEIVACALAKTRGVRHPSVEAFLAAVREVGAAATAEPRVSKTPDLGLWVSAELPGDVAASDETALLDAVDAVLTRAEARCQQAGLEVLTVAPCAILATGHGGRVDLRAATAIAAAVARDPARGRLVVRVGVSRHDVFNPDRWPPGSFLPIAAD